MQSYLNSNLSLIFIPDLEPFKRKSRPYPGREQLFEVLDHSSDRWEPCILHNIKLNVFLDENGQVYELFFFFRLLKFSTIFLVSLVNPSISISPDP